MIVPLVKWSCRSCSQRGRRDSTRPNDAPFFFRRAVSGSSGFASAQCSSSLDDAARKGWGLGALPLHGSRGKPLHHLLLEDNVDDDGRDHENDSTRCEQTLFGRVLTAQKKDSEIERLQR